MKEEDRAREVLYEAELAFKGPGRLYRTEEAQAAIVGAMLAFANPPAADVSDVAGLREAASAAREILAGVGAKIDSGECASAITPKIGGKRYVVMPFETYEGDLIRRFERGKAAALAHNPAPAAASVGEGMREAIARVIAPGSWVLRERHLEYAEQADYADHREQWVDRADEDVASSLAKADAILALARDAAGVDGGAAELEWLEDRDNLILANGTQADGWWEVRRGSVKGEVRGRGPTPRKALRAAMIAAAPIAQPAEEEA